MVALHSCRPQDARALADVIRKDLDTRLPALRQVATSLEELKFRDSSGCYWTLGPQSRTWYAHRNSGWAPSPEPSAELDAPAALVTQVIAQTNDDEVGEIRPQSTSVEFIARAVARVRESYKLGRLSSEMAENRLLTLFLLDDAGGLWTAGVHTCRWYCWRQGAWAAAAAAPPVDSLMQTLDGEPDERLFEARLEFFAAVEDLQKSGAPLVPEAVVKPWNPPAGFPENLARCPRCELINVTLQPRCEFCEVNLGTLESTQEHTGMRNIFTTRAPSVGLVIGTFAATPYVHLHLESRARNYPHMPVLVHDDGSPKRDELQKLCERYGGDFISAPQRTRPTIGDLSTFVDGLDWAHERQITLLVKMSRRFIPFYNFSPELFRLAYESQSATFSHRCLHFNFGFRTECIALHVETWRKSGALDKMRSLVERNEPVFVEGLIHNLARDIQRAGVCDANREYVRNHPQPPDADAYAVWSIMNDRRTTRKDDVLWHDCDDAQDYARAAVLFHLPYGRNDFRDPNQGYGTGDK